jgi:hypothetical protein
MMVVRTTMRRSENSSHILPDSFFSTVTFSNIFEGISFLLYSAAFSNKAMASLLFPLLNNQRGDSGIKL